MQRTTVIGYYIFQAIPGDLSNGVIRVSKPGYHVIRETWEGSLILNVATVFWSSDESEAQKRLAELQAG